ncbi:MAG: ATP-binding protein [Fimbriimonadaceae bacterium]
MPRQEDIIVEVGSDVLKGAASCEPADALEELIWNSLDADATRVDVTTNRNELGGLNSLSIVDNGSGFEVSAREAFGSFGTSAKKNREKTTNGRLLHGKTGRGRYKALTLGSIVTWQSVSKHFDSYLLTKLNIDSTHPNRISPIEDTIESPSFFGTKVEIMDVLDPAVVFLLGDPQQELSRRFASYLLAYPAVSIFIDGKRLNPDDNIIGRSTKQISTSSNDRTFSAELELFVWRDLGSDGKPISKVYFCTADGFAVENHPGYTRSLGVSITAYVRSDYFNPDNTEGYSQLSPLDEIATGFLRSARRYIGQLNREWLHALARERVLALKESGNYPFEGEPLTEIERVEREVFDIVAEQYHILAPNVAKEGSTEEKKKMEVLRVAISTETSVQEFLIKEVLGLKPEQHKSLYSVLQHVPLANVVHMAKTVIDRLHFLVGLRHILFETESKKLLKERTQLHRILAENLWLFGEEYHLAADDISLKKVLLRHRQLLELDESAFEIQAEAAKKLRDIPDLVLYRTLPGRGGNIEHFVVELKAPKSPSGEKEISQIKRYARTVADSDDFDKSKTRWVFMLINNDFEDSIYNSEAMQMGREEGLIIENDSYQVWAVHWSTIIQKCEARHQFLKERLDYQIAEDKPALDYMRESFGHLLPDTMSDDETEVYEEEFEDDSTVDPDQVG